MVHIPLVRDGDIVATLNRRTPTPGTGVKTNQTGIKKKSFMDQQKDQSPKDRLYDTMAYYTTVLVPLLHDKYGRSCSRSPVPAGELRCPAVASTRSLQARAIGTQSFFALGKPISPKL